MTALIWIIIGASFICCWFALWVCILATAKCLREVKKDENT